MLRNCYDLHSTPVTFITLTKLGVILRDRAESEMINKHRVPTAAVVRILSRGGRGLAEAEDT